MMIPPCKRPHFYTVVCVHDRDRVPVVLKMEILNSFFLNNKNVVALLPTDMIISYYYDDDY